MEDASPTRPHIVLIVSDQHRRDWLGCAETPGSRYVHTPHIDALAQRGVRFRSAYCPYPLCGPSRMALMTGREPHRLGMYVNEHTLRSDVPTVAHALAIAGYETVLAGRMHFTGADQRHGFETRLVGDVNAGYPGGPKAFSGDDAAEMGNPSQAAAMASPGDGAGPRYDEAVTAAAARHLAERRERGEDRPLLLVVGLFEPHHPFRIHQEDYQRALKRLRDAGDRLQAPGELHPEVAASRRKPKTGSITAEQVQVARATYAGMIDHVDRLVGRVLEAAEQHLDGPALAIYTSDHGEMAGDRGLWGKTVMHEASAGVPLVVAPLRVDEGEATGVARGEVLDTPASLVDLAPTLAATAGAPPIPGVDGADLTPLLGDPSLAAEPRWRDRAAMCQQCSRFPGSDGRLVVNRPATRMVRRGDWKLVYYHDCDPPVTLHHLGDDPLEERDLAADPAHAPVRETLLQLALADWDPVAIGEDANRRARDVAYLMRWGREAGRRSMGPMDVWVDEGTAQGMSTG